MQELINARKYTHNIKYRLHVYLNIINAKTYCTKYYILQFTVCASLLVVSCWKMQVEKQKKTMDCGLLFVDTYCYKYQYFVHDWIYLFLNVLYS